MVLWVLLIIFCPFYYLDLVTRCSRKFIFLHYTPSKIQPPRPPWRPKYVLSLNSTTNRNLAHCDVLPKSGICDQHDNTLFRVIVLLGEGNFCHSLSAIKILPPSPPWRPKYVSSRNSTTNRNLAHAMYSQKAHGVPNKTIFFSG